MHRWLADSSWDTLLEVIAAIESLQSQGSEPYSGLINPQMFNIAPLILKISLKCVS